MRGCACFEQISGRCDGCAAATLIRFRHALNRNTRRGSRRNIAAHYDLGNDFYVHGSIAGMTYSSATLFDAEQTLEAAQRNKLDRVIDLMALTGGERVLEIGCGWGGLAECMIRALDCDVTGLTLSTEQLAMRAAAVERGSRTIRPSAAGLSRRERGFRPLVSIEMLEAVGEAYWPRFFATARTPHPRAPRCCRSSRSTRGASRIYRRRPDFIQRYIFPGGMLPTRGILERLIAESGLQLISIGILWRELCPHASRLASPLSGSMAVHRGAWVRRSLQTHVGVLSGLLPAGL